MENLGADPIVKENPVILPLGSASQPELLERDEGKLAQPWKELIEEINKESSVKGDPFTPSNGFNDHSLAG